jgi:acyl-[acyl-carrier-protein]-phospholipid O-acyltransferase / long-chain-fatty-acid--[acyl-carrier-protein] ligase
MSFFFARRFQPLFQTQFLGAFNDNLLKNALVMMLTYQALPVSGATAGLLITAAGSILVVPSLLFSSLAGELADKLDKAWLARLVKLAEIAIMAIAAAGFFMHSIALLFAALLGMGLHSTFFGPLKLALLPQHLLPNELLAGNAYIEAGTFLAILVGTLVGGQLVMLPGGRYVTLSALLIVALAGYAASRRIPDAPSLDPALKLHGNSLRESIVLIADACRNRTVARCIFGISWFWLAGTVIVSQIAPFIKSALHGGPSLVTLLLALFSIGTATGALVSNVLLRGQVQVTYVPLAVLAMSLFGFDLAAAHLAVPGLGLLGLGAFLHHAAAWRVMADVFGLAAAGGMFIVPLYALLQQESTPEHRARIIAACNLVNALFMAGVSAIMALALHAGFSLSEIFALTAASNLVVALYICRLLPDALLRSLLRAVLGVCFRVEVSGLEHYQAAGKRVLIVANHTSFLDAVLLATFLPEKLNFAVNTHIARKWWMRPVHRLVKTLALDPTNPLAAKTLIDLLKQDQKCVIFPEGRLTVTGALMKIYEGPGMIADKAMAKLLPIRIDGAQYTRFSHLKGKVHIRFFPRIRLTILPPCEFDIDPALKGRARRQVAGARLYDLMSGMMFESTAVNQPLFQALLTAKEVHGRHKIAVEDIERKPLSYGSLITRAFILGRLLKRNVTAPRVGLMLPNSAAAAVSFFALQAVGKTPAMLNFSAGSAALLSACRTAEINSIVTSRRFLSIAKLEKEAAALEEAGRRLLYLEDFAPQIGIISKFLGLVQSLAPRITYRLIAGRIDAEHPAVFLFTSGSEGTPKGVVLSHRNLRANCAQLAARVDFGPQDKVLNVLPMFHAFGLTGGTLLPLLSGIHTFLYPSPLHYRIVPELAYDTNATIMFGTDTFLSGYGRFANPYDLNAMRYIFAGAERLRDETRRVYMEKFGVRILEGYGATETAPVLAMNTPMQSRAGTVGRLLPGVEHRLVPVPGIGEGGLLHVRGPNVMAGYLRAANPGVLEPPEAGWYDTGDIVTIDADGYVTIKGRAKRFAKLGGEMVSLAAVEEEAQKLWPAARHAALAVPDARKGEQIVLLTEAKDATREELLRAFRAHNLPDLAVPRAVVVTLRLPLLSTGKIDYPNALAWLTAKTGAEAA